MQENNFEKEVRGMMDDLEISPSAPVWEYVEKRIPKSDRKRRFIALFLLVTGFAVCGYFFYGKFFSGNTTSINTEMVPGQPITLQNNKEDIIVQDTVTVQDTTAAVLKTITAATSKSKVSKIVKQSVPTIVLQKVTDVATRNTDNNAKSSAASFDINIAEKNSTVSATDMNAVSTPELIQTEAVTHLPGHTEIYVDSASYALKTSKDNPHLFTNEMDTLPEKKQAHAIPAASKKWQWGITALYGRADVVQHFLDISNDKSYVFNGSLSQGNGNSRIDTAFLNNQSKIVQPRSAFSIGMVMHKPLTSRSSITTGIEYSQLRTLVQTGSAKDSNAVFYYNNSTAFTSLERFYTAGFGSSQVNKYKMLQVPVLYSYRLINNKKITLTADAGVSLSYIVSSDAFIYDSYNLAYYKNEDLIRTTQVQLLGGFNMEFPLKSKSSFSVGPQFQYGLTGVIKDHNQQHFFTWGMQARYFIKSK